MKAIFAKLLGISKEVMNWLMILVSSQAMVSISKLLPIALGLVLELAQNGDIAKPDKQKIAIAKLSDAAKAEGIVAGTNVLTMVVEMAVAQMKSQTTK